MLFSDPNKVAAKAADGSTFNRSRRKSATIGVSRKEADHATRDRRG